MIKAIISITATKPDMYGNTYRTGTITNTRNGKSTLVFKANSAGNVESVTRSLLALDWSGISTSETSTGSARLSSLPNCAFLRPAELAAELRKIGFRVPAERVKQASGCL
jgi:hypothetical protein